MLFERIESEGLAHFSYLVGAAGRAVVIDPRRDCDVYLERAERAGYRIVDVLETHRNEDYVSGAVELASRTGARVWHADAELDYGYGEAVADGQRWDVGPCVLEAIATPGHTVGSKSYLLADTQGHAWALFCGDTLFAGAAGRTDLAGAAAQLSLTELLYESIHERLLPLGDGVILCPAHGKGSACGAAIADRPVSTLGFERAHSPLLSLERAAFIREIAVELDRPPYFTHMEDLNLAGPPLLCGLPDPRPTSPDELEAAAAAGAQLLDVRDNLAFASAHVPGSLFCQTDSLGSYAGWFLDWDTPIVLVIEGTDPTEPVQRLVRMGFDRIEGHLSSGMLAWHTAGKESRATATVVVQRLCHGLDAGDPHHILDVRTSGELDHLGRIPGAQHIPLSRLVQRMDEVPADRPVFIFCGSGLRSMIAASLLEQAGRRDMSVILGGFAGWISDRCPIER